MKNSRKIGIIHRIVSIAPLLRVLALLGMVLGFQACNSGEESRKKILKIYNWADYIDEKLLTEFPKWYKQQTGEEVEIVYQVFDMPEVMYTKVALGHEDFDLVCPTQYLIERMMQNGLLQPIDRRFGKTPDNFHNISPFMQRWMESFTQKGMKASDYMVPYMWSTSGIMYNTKFVTDSAVQSWECLWDKKNRGMILMKDHYWDVYNMAATRAYYKDIVAGKRTLFAVSNDHTDADIAAVEQQLKQLRPNLAGWEADFGKDMMTKGKIWLNYAWSGDAVWAIQEAADVGVELNYVIPREGSNISFDGWVIPKYAGNVKAASYFLNYLCMPDVALRNMEVSGYSSAIASPEIRDAQIDSTISETVNLNYFFGPGNDSLHVNRVQYPDSAEVARCVMLHDFGSKNEAVLEMWSRAKGDSLNLGMTIVIFSFLLGISAFLIYRRVKRVLGRRRMRG